LDYPLSSIFEWNSAKSDACVRMRGFDFAYAASAFADPHRIVREDNRFVYGEARFQLIGRVEGRLFVLAYTPRSDAIRIISARKANPREVRRYETRPQED
jgi:uncharacterized DUF497 family protein